MARVQSTWSPTVPWNGHHHPVILSFPRWSGVSDGTYCYDFLGVRTDPRFRVQYRPDPSGPISPKYPTPQPIYFELIFVLSAVRDAVARGKRPFTMIEAGAGYGYWLATAHRALQSLSPQPARLVGVEMVPQHVAWLRRHLADNGVPDAEVSVIHAGVSGRDGTGSFVPEPDPGMAYGQHLSGGGGNSAVPVPLVSLNTLVAPLPYIDLLHMDVQGAEWDALSTAMPTLAGRVARLFVATHGRLIHRKVRRLLSDAGWRCVMDYGVRERAVTPFGTVRFLDGVLAWENPRLLATSAGASVPRIAEGEP
jgi:FkbM family methyltransferase